MSRFGLVMELDRTALLVWAAMIAAGAVAWVGSGTPLTGAVIVLSVLLAAASPNGAFYATCAAIPLIFHPIAVGSLSFGFLELGLVVTAFGASIRVLYDLVNGGQLAMPPWVRPFSIWILPAALLAIGSLSLIWMPFRDHSAEAWRSWRWVIVEPLAAYVLARYAIARDGRPPLTMAISMPAVVVALAAIWQLVDATSSFSVDQVHRSTATYLHPNNLALYLERSVFLVMIPGLLIGGRLRFPLLALSAVLAIGLATTFSRGALLGLAAGGAVFLLAHPVRRGWFVLAGGLVASVVAFGLLASQRFTGADSSGIVSTRRFLWADAVQMIRDFPLTGIGLDQFLGLHQQRYIDPRIWSERYTSHPHNLLLDAWLSLGIVGVVLLMTMLLAGGWIIVMARRGGRRCDPWQLGALACLGAGLGHGVVDNGYFLPDLAVLTWLAIALLLTQVRPERGLDLVNTDV